jgi:predicted TPR repeat methyltransferase
MSSSEAPERGRGREAAYEITLPSGTGTSQDQEWCLVRKNGSERRMRFHDYGDLYREPGLYEQLFYDELECSSPQTVVGLLADELERTGFDPDNITALDVGAGNGMVGEELEAIGASTIYGVDIIPEAAEATERDRPDTYEGYFVVDLTDLPGDVRRDWEDAELNLLTCVAALGFGDIPPEAFATAYDLLQPGGWLAFCIKEEFVERRNGQSSGFSRLIYELADRGHMEIRAQERYRHRLATNGDPLHYVAMVARKVRGHAAAPLVTG